MIKTQKVAEYVHGERLRIVLAINGREPAYHRIGRAQSLHRSHRTFVWSADADHLSDATGLRRRLQISKGSACQQAAHAMTDQDQLFRSIRIQSSCKCPAGCEDVMAPIVIVEHDVEARGREPQFQP